MRKIFAALVLGSLVALAGGVQAQDKHWVATWGTAPALTIDTPLNFVRPPPANAATRDAPAAAAPPRDPPRAGPIPPVPPLLEAQTVRMVLRSSIGGEQVRLYFSNAQGLPPVTLGAVHLAVHTDGGAVDPATDRVVTFGGKSSVTLHPGALIVSDPVALPIKPLSELAVSVYLPQSTDTRGKHELALNTTYIGKGDLSAAAQFTASETNRSWFWLTGMDVLAPAQTGAIIAFGDSITDGFATTADQHQAWPALLAERLQQTTATNALAVINMGISGNRVLRTVTGASALTRFDRDALVRSGARWIVLLEGINDINFTALPGSPPEQQTTADEIIEGLSQLVDRAHASGIKVMGATLTPMGGLWLFNEKTEAMRQAVNKWVRNSGKYDAVVDFDAATRDPQMPERLLPAYDSGDHIHPNDAGNKAMAAAIDVNAFLR